MFTNTYSSSPLVGAAADEIFPNIQCEWSVGDVTLPATMRVLLHDRLPDGQTAKLVYKEAPSSLFGSNLSGELSSLFDGYDLSKVENHLFVLNVSCPSADVRDAILKKFSEASDIHGMTLRAAIEKTLFGPIRSKAQAFIDADRACSLVVVVSGTTSLFCHSLAYLIPRFFARFYEHDAKGHLTLTSFEENFLKNCIADAKNSQGFEASIQQFSERFDFRTPKIKALLKDFEQSYSRARLGNLDRQIAKLVGEIKDVNATYARLVRRKRNLTEEHFALQLGLEKETKGETLMDYFLTNKNVSLVRVDDHVVTFDARAPIANFDSIAMESIMADRHRGSRAPLYANGPSSVSKEDRDLLYKALFIDQTIRVWACGRFTLCHGDSTRISALSGEEPSPEMHDCCPNPHLYNHGCMGDNQRYANDALLEGDFIAAMEQTIGSVASVNLQESITTQYWPEHLLDDRYGRIFETSDAQRMTFTEVMKYLKEEKKDA